MPRLRVVTSVQIDSQMMVKRVGVLSAIVNDLVDFLRLKNRAQKRRDLRVRTLSQHVKQENSGS